MPATTEKPAPKQQEKPKPIDPKVLIEKWVDKQEVEFNIAILNIHNVFGPFWRVDAYEKINDGFMVRNKIQVSWFLKVFEGQIEDQSK